MQLPNITRQPMLPVQTLLGASLLVLARTGGVETPALAALLLALPSAALAWRLLERFGLEPSGSAKLGAACGLLALGAATLGLGLELDSLFAGTCGGVITGAAVAVGCTRTRVSGSAGEGLLAPVGGAVLALALTKLWMVPALADPAFACLGMGSLALVGALASCLDWALPQTSGAAKSTLVVKVEGPVWAWPR